MQGTVTAWIDGQAIVADQAEQTDPASVVHIDDERSRSVSLFDLAVQRGDGIFEATSVWRGVPLSLRPHLARLQHSAFMLDLPELNIQMIGAAAHLAIAAYRERFHPRDDEEQMLKIIVTRGSDPQLLGGRELDPGTPHVWILVDHRSHDPRHPDPIRLIALPKGISVRAAEEQPWMLWGAKTLSYAMNKATYRECERRGADSAIFYSTENLMLECPTSSIVFRIDNHYFTPEPTQGILYGTTQREFFVFLDSIGLHHEYGRYPIEMLEEADAIWTLGGSTAHAVISYEGKALTADNALTEQANIYAREHHDEVAAASLAELARFGL